MCLLGFELRAFGRAVLTTEPSHQLPYSPSWRSVRARTRGRNLGEELKWRPWRNDAYWHSPFGRSLPSYTPQDPLSRDGTVGPSNQSPIKKMPYSLATVNLMWASSQLKCCFPDNSSLCQLEHLAPFNLIHQHTTIKPELFLPCLSSIFHTLISILQHE